MILVALSLYIVGIIPAVFLFRFTATYYDIALMCYFHVILEDIDIFFLRLKCAPSSINNVVKQYSQLIKVKCLQVNCLLLTHLAFKFM